MYVIGINDFKVRWLAPSLQNANVTLAITWFAWRLQEVKFGEAMLMSSLRIPY